MKFTTDIAIEPSADHLTHHDRVLMLGSCFTDEIGERLLRDKFDVVVNPFGTLYNPASISAHLLRCLSEREYDSSSPEIIEVDDLWHSWMHHSSFSAPTRDELIDRMNTTMRRVGERLRTADWLILSFGTSFVYRLLPDGMLVSNCHKQPDSMFLRQRMAAVDIVDMWTTTLQILHSVNPGLKVVFTVSPIRHRRDGLHENNLSKAELLLAVSALGQTYFPAYEILLDELRDYRFYADDLVHPSSLAADYIYERFSTAFITAEEQQISTECRRLGQRLRHRQLTQSRCGQNKFAEQTASMLAELKQKYPYIDFTVESELCNTLFSK